MNLDVAFWSAVICANIWTVSDKHFMSWLWFLFAVFIFLIKNFG